ncbi:DUF551 domain-containing protein [Enterobacter kobei]|uniref:DUF551 domain-containing protein n=1 Tax=Enterobacter kobei TaxID=208224 RepID=UPI002FD0026F
MSTITKERIEQYANDPRMCNVNDEIRQIALIALASLEAEAVADVVAWSSPNEERTCDVRLRRHDINAGPLYTAPPAPVSVPDEDLLHMAASAIEDLLSSKDRSGAGVWADIPAKLRRAAMLQGAVGNSPVIPDGWVACSERMPDKGQNVLISVNFDSPLIEPLICSARYTGSTFRRGDVTVKPGEGVEEVTHWMPLPAAPQQEVK